MTDATNQTADQTAEPPQQPVVRLLSHYTRDLSFENVGAIQETQAEGSPEISVNVGMDAKALGDDRYQVNTKINAKATVADSTRFLVELDYAGVFSITNIKQEHLHPFLFIECPRQVFPFARRVVSDVTRDGGYPPLMIDNIDFVRLYREKIEEMRAQQGDGDGAGAEQSAEV